MNCPRCHLSLVPVDYDGVQVDLCEQCWGMWLDRGELKQMFGAGQLDFSKEERERILDVRKAWDQGPEEPAACPKCGKKMQRLSYDASVHLMIDRCPQHGTWLDTGEIKKVKAIAEKSRAVHRLLLEKLGL